MKETTSKKQLAINLTTSFLATFLGVAINFWLSPYIVKNIGVEANGFIQLAGNFITYAGLITMALNSMGGRFITIAYVQNNFKEANNFYNSLYWANIILGIILLIPILFIIIHLSWFINIPQYLLVDTQALFILAFANFFVSMFTPKWEVSTYIKNRLDRTNIPNMIISLIRSGIIILLFTLFKPHMWYMSFAALIATVLGLMVAQYNAKELIPELRISLKRQKRIFSTSHIKRLIKSGIWNSINGLGGILNTGSDMLISNLFLGAKEMGIIALAYTLSNLMKMLPSTFLGTFSPEVTINYAKGNKNELYNNLSRAMKITGIFLTIPLSIIYTFGDIFFTLWIPSQNTELLHILTILSLISLTFTSGVQVLNNVFVITDTVKYNSYAMLIQGILTCAVTIYFCKHTNLGIYAVVGISAIGDTIRNVIFMVPFTTKCLGFKWNTFFHQISNSIISVFTLVLINLLIKYLFSPTTWMEFILTCGLSCCIGFITNTHIILNKQERIFLLNTFYSKIKKH